MHQIRFSLNSLDDQYQRSLFTRFDIRLYTYLLRSYYIILSKMYINIIIIIIFLSTLNVLFLDMR